MLQLGPSIPPDLDAEYLELTLSQGIGAGVSSPPSAPKDLGTLEFEGELTESPPKLANSHVSETQKTVAVMGCMASLITPNPEFN